MTSDPWPIWGILIFLLLIGANGYFVAAIRAIGFLNRVVLRESAEDGDERAKALLPVTDNLPYYELVVRSFSILVYIVCILDAVFVCHSRLSELIRHYLCNSAGGSVFLSLAVIAALSAVLILAFGDALPRRLAVIHDDAIALRSGGAVKILAAFLKPMTVSIRVIVFLMLKLLHQRTDVEDNEYSEEDIVEMLEAGQESGELKEEGKKMITGVFAFDDILAYEIMTPRTDVFAIDINAPSETYIDELMGLRYSRVPVYEDDSDNIIGILYIKDYLIKAWENGFDHVDIQSVLRKPYFVPETKNIDSLFIELQKTKQHIAILIDEYGGFCGIVTMEDIIEEVMGDIDDEYDETEQEIRRIGRDLYVIEGSTSIDDLDEELNIDLESEDSETIGGFIIDMFGEIPNEGDIGKEIFYENYVFTIKSVKDRRIEQVTMKILPKLQRVESGETID